MTGASASADRATHEPSPDGLGHSAAIPGANQIMSDMNNLARRILLLSKQMCNTSYDSVAVTRHVRKRAVAAMVRDTATIFEACTRITELATECAKAIEARRASNATSDGAAARPGIPDIGAE